MLVIHIVSVLVMRWIAIKLDGEVNDLNKFVVYMPLGNTVALLVLGAIAFWNEVRSLVTKY